MVVSGTVCEIHCSEEKNFGVNLTCKREDIRVDTNQNESSL